jgi:prophage regulatory protein
MDNISILRINDVTARTALSRSSVYLMISRGEFPAPAKLGQRAVGWSSADIDAWIAARFANLAKAA